MATIAQLENGLRKAHAAGNADHARAFAAEIRRVRAVPKPLVMQDGSSAADAGARLQAENAEQMRNDPTKDMHFGQTLAAGFGQSLADSGRSAKQLTGNMTREEVDAARRTDAPLKRTAGGAIGSVLGTAAQILGPGGVLKLGARVPQLAAAAPALNVASQAFLPHIAGTGARIGSLNVLANAAQGAAFSALQPVGTGESRGLNTLAGAGFGGAGALVPRVGGWGAGAARNAIAAQTEKGSTRLAADLIRRESGNPAALMTPNPSQVPGVNRTLYDETLDPAVARLETRARGSGTAAWVDNDSANNVARSRALGGIAGDGAAIAAAQKARDRVALPLLASAKRDTGIDVTPVRKAIDGMEKRYAPRESVQKAIVDVRRSLDAAGDDVASLYEVRKSIGDLMDGRAGADKAYARTAKKQLMVLRNLLDQQMAAKSPDFAKYLTAYRDGSKAVDRLKIGRTLIDDGTGPKFDPATGAYVLQPGKFGAQVKNLPRAVKKATGFPGQPGDYLTPDDFRLIHAVDDDLTRLGSRLERGQGGGGSQTASQQSLAGRVAKSMLKLPPYLGGLIEVADQAAQKRLTVALDTVLKNPAEYRRVAAKLSSSDRKLFQHAMNRIGGTGGAIMLPASE